MARCAGIKKCSSPILPAHFATTCAGEISMDPSTPCSASVLCGASPISGRLLLWGSPTIRRVGLFLDGIGRRFLGTNRVLFNEVCEVARWTHGRWKLLEQLVLIGVHCKNEAAFCEEEERNLRSSMKRSTSATTKRFALPSFTYDSRGRRPAVQYDNVRGLTFSAAATSLEVTKL